jgi:HAD superfamily hydrolase (TIGR01549 family)
MAEAVFFDLWNTLLYCPTKERVRDIIACLRLTGKVGYLEVIGHMGKSIFVDGRYGLERMFKEMSEQYDGAGGAKAVKEASRIWEGRLEHAKLFPETAGALESLSDYKLAIVSNTDVSGAEYVRERGIDEYFDLIVMSCYVGVAKPDPSIYRLAAKELGLKPKDCWMVGDSLECDFEGAKRAGLNALHLDRGGETVRHYRVGSLADVAEAIG